MKYEEPTTDVDITLKFNKPKNKKFKKIVLKHIEMALKEWRKRHDRPN